jgi:hypothetical protein
LKLTAFFTALGGGESDFDLPFDGESIKLLFIEAATFPRLANDSVAEDFLIALSFINNLESRLLFEHYMSQM